MGQQIYAHPVKPENYPDYKERHAKAVTREALNHEIQFTSLRVFSTDNTTKMLTDFKSEIDLYTKTFRLGNVLWPVYKTLFAENFEELADEVQKRGLYMFDFWGYVPGSQPQEDVIWGEYEVPQKAHEALKRLDGHFLGFDNGEQDGRYIGTYARVASPVANSRKVQYRSFQAHFEKLGNAMKNHMVTLSSLPFLHYFAKEGNTIMLGAETAQALPNSSMWFSFIRGAAKQYGLLMFGNASIWNRWGYKCYESSGKDGYEWGEDCGTSLSLLRRLIYSHYVYGCEILGFENGWIMGDSVEKRLKNEEVLMDNDKSTCTLTPVGKIQQYCGEFVRKYGRPGTLYTPLAIVSDFFAGWNPPRHLYTKDIYKAWGNLPYRSGDYQLHGLFSMLYPGYENAGFFHDESGFLTPTPYGEIADVLLNDVRYEILSQYGAALVTNGTELTLEFYDILKRYVQNGGDLIIFADTLKEAFTKIKEYDVEAARFFSIEELGTKAEKAYTVCYNGANYSEKGGIYDIKPLTSTEIAVTAQDGMPIVLKNKFGSGTVTVFLLSDGLVDQGGFSAENEPNKDICRPIDFSAFVKVYLGDIFDRLYLARPNNRDLQYCASVKDGKTLTLYVSNSSFVDQQFKIESGEYGIESVCELPIEDGIPEDKQFFPFHSTEAKEENKTDGHFLKCGDAKIFEVQLEKPLALKPESVPKANQNNLYLSIAGFSGSVKQFILDHPTFQHHFKGVMIPAEYLHRLETGEAAREAEYLNRKNVRVLVDFSAALDHYPGLSLLDNLPERKTESMDYIKNVLEKAAKYRCAGVLVQMHRNAECSFSVEKAKQSFVDAFAQIGEMANEYSISVYAQNRPVLTDTAEFFDLVKNIPSVKPAFNYSNSVCAGDKTSEISKQFGGSMALLSAPAKDGFGQLYNMWLPIAGSEYENELREMGTAFKVKKNSVIVLAAEYNDWDDVYKDLSCLRLI